MEHPYIELYMKQLNSLQLIKTVKVLKHPLLAFVDFLFILEKGGEAALTKIINPFKRKRYNSDCMWPLGVTFQSQPIS